MLRSIPFRVAAVGLVLSSFLWSCQTPLVPVTGAKATLTLSFGPPVGRTVVPDLQPVFAAVYSIDLQIERTDVVSTPYVVTVTGAGIASTTKTLTDLEAGTYTIDATAYDNTLSSPIAYGKQLTLIIAAGDVRADTIVLAPSLNTGTGDLNLKVSYPHTAGVTSVVANLTSRGGDSSHDFSLRSLTETLGGARDSVTLVENGLPVGAYDLELVFTENGTPRTYQQAVNVFQGQTADHVIDGAGALQTEWALSEEYFGSSTFLADVVLTTTDTTHVASGIIEEQGFSSPTRGYNLVTNAGWYQLTATQAYAGQTIDFWDGAAATPGWVGLSSGIATGILNMDVDPEYETLNLRVTSPGGARGYYVFHLIRAGGATLSAVAAPVVSIVSPSLGQVTWAQNETVTASATSTTAGDWAWYFDAVPVAGQTSSTFSATASSLSTTLGDHLLMAMFTDSQGFTWTEHLLLKFIDQADVIVSIKTQQTRVNLSGSSPWVYNTADTDGAETLSIGFDDGSLQQVRYGIDNFDAPVTLAYPTDFLSSFSISGVGLGTGFHTLLIQAQFANGTFAGAMISFEVKSRPAGSSSSPFVVALADRYFPAIYANNNADPWKAQWYADDVTSIDFTVQIPSLGPGDQSALLHYSLGGKDYVQDVSSGASVDLSIALSDFVGGLPPGIYPLTLDLWAGPSPGERRSVGTLTVIVRFLGGLDESNS